MRDVMLALIIPMVEMGVLFVENAYPNAKGQAKRLRAFKYVKDRINNIVRILGPIGVMLEDSAVLGAIDAAVLSRNQQQEFETSGDNAMYSELGEDSGAVSWVDERGVRRWTRFDEKTGEMIPVKVRNVAGGGQTPVIEPAMSTGPARHIEEPVLQDDEPPLPETETPARRAGKRAPARKK